MTSDPAYGIGYLRRVLPPVFANRWCYLAEDGSSFGISREELTQACLESDVYLNLSNINWIPELELCKRRVLIDTDPVFTQIGGFGIGGRFSRYQACFTYGENVHKAGCEMPTAGVRWLPTRQPVVLDLWPASPGDPNAAFTSVMNWSAYGDREYQGKVFGQKDREFSPFWSLPSETAQPMEMAINAPLEVRQRMASGGWRLAHPGEVTRDPWTYQRYLRASRGEFGVAKHAYVVTKSGWFSDRSSAYLAMGRPVVVQDTGFSDFLPSGAGLLPFRTPQEAVRAIGKLNHDYPRHCRAARSVIEEHFDAQQVLTRLLEQSI